MSIHLISILFGCAERKQVRQSLRAMAEIRHRPMQPSSVYSGLAASRNPFIVLLALLPLFALFVVSLDSHVTQSDRVNCLVCKSAADLIAAELPETVFLDAFEPAFFKMPVDGAPRPVRGVILVVCARPPPKGTAS